MQSIISLRPGMTAAITGRVLNAGLAADAPARLQAVLGAGAGRQRPDPGGVAEPGVPQGRHQVAPAHRPVRQGRDLGLARAADHGSRIRDREGSASREPGDAEADGDASCIPAESCRSTNAPAASRPTCSGGSCGRRSIRSPMAGSIRCRTTSSTRALAGSQDRDLAIAFPVAGHRRRRPERVHHAGAAANGVRGLLRLPNRAGAAPPRERAGPQRPGVDGRRSHPPVRARGAAVQADRRAARRAGRDRRRHAAHLADAAAAAGRRRRRQDDRRAARGDRGDGERLPGGVHGADRDPRRAALPHDRRTDARRTTAMASRIESRS